MSNEVAKDKAVRLLRKRQSVSSTASGDKQQQLQQPDHQFHTHGSVGTSYVDEQDGGYHETQTFFRPSLRMENTYQLNPSQRFPENTVRDIIREVFENYLGEGRYEPELCRQLSKTLAEVLKGRVKDLSLDRYKIVSIVHIGELKCQGIRLGSRCLLDHAFDTFTTYEFRNQYMFAVGAVYGLYSD